MAPPDPVSAPGAEPLPPTERRRRLGELARLFLRLGATTFGGPAVHLAVMEEEVVRRRGWLSPGEYLDLMGATQLLPGPNSTEMAIYIGHRRAGRAGLWVAGSCFILPATLVTAVLAWVYVEFGHLPNAAGLLAGVRPVILAIVAQAIWRFSRTAIKNRWLAVAGVAALGMCLAGVHELAVIFGVGLSVAACSSLRQGPAPTPSNGPGRTLNALGAGFGAPVAWAAAATGTTSGAVTLGPLFLAFLKAGGLLFGSGYVLLAYLRADLVERLGWLTEAQLLDAIVVGQATPGPVFSTATFVGYLLAGVPGAGVATAGIFAPAFALVGLSHRLVPRLRASPRAGAFLDGVNVASLALMAFVTGRMAAGSLQSPWAVVVALGAGLLLVRFRVNPTWLLLGGAVGGVWVAAWFG